MTSGRTTRVVVILFIVALTLTGCGRAPGGPTPTSVGLEPTETPTPSDTAAPTPSDTAAPTPLNVAVAIAPTSGPPGTQVDVVARGFPPQAVVEIGIGRVDSEYDVIATARTDADGRAETQITIPDFVDPEDRWVIVVTAEDLPVQAVSDEFDVTGRPTPSPPGGNLFTRTNIYLIAVGDEGQNGKEIGCGDSVISVEVEIEPTIAPLTAALEELLAIDTRLYGQSGLYNALYQSDLTLESVNIVNSTAVIRLTGTLTLGGVCDEPRVEAQLKETALQYTTVDQVSVFINGTPLDEVLGGEGN